MPGCGQVFDKIQFQISCNVPCVTCTLFGCISSQPPCVTSMDFGHTYETTFHVYHIIHTVQLHFWNNRVWQTLPQEDLEVQPSNFHFTQQVQLPCLTKSINNLLNI